MDERHIPSVGLRYWLVFGALCAFGSVWTDLAHTAMPIGVGRRLLFYSVILVAIFLVERWDRSTTDVWYWMATSVVQIVASRLALLLTEGLGFDLWEVALSLAVVFLVVMVMARSDESHMFATMQLERPGLAAKPLADTAHWLGLFFGSMFAATFVDLFDQILRSNAVLVIAVLSPCSAILLYLGRRYGPTLGRIFWLNILIVCALASAISDLLTDHTGFHLRLSVAAFLLLVLSLGLIFLWRPRRGY